MTTIDIYPKCRKPSWLKVGVKCLCWGEGNDILTVVEIGKNAAFMEKGLGKYRRGHGWESFKKLHSPISQIETKNFFD